MNTNQQKLLNEFLAGFQVYQYETLPESQAHLDFFIAHQHQVATDDDHYDHFIECFPNFFEYANHPDIFKGVIS